MTWPVGCCTRARRQQPPVTAATGVQTPALDRTPLRYQTEPYPIAHVPVLETVSESASPEPTYAEDETPPLSQHDHHLAQFERRQLEQALHAHTRAQARRQLEKSLQRNALSHEGLEHFLRMHSRVRAQRSLDQALCARTASHNELANSEHELIAELPDLSSESMREDSMRRNRSTQW